MTIAATDFIGAFPEFSNNAVYPISQINFWIKQAYIGLNAAQFDQSLDLAAMLFAAHNMVLSARDAAATAMSNPGAPPGIPGQATGPVNSKGVGQVHIGYDTAATQMPGAGAWNATSYGQRLYRMMVAVEAGGMYVPSWSGASMWPLTGPGNNWPLN
jgi:hypothetical protein